LQISLTLARIQELNEKAPPGIQIVLVGNKIDCEQRQVKADTAATYANNQGLLYQEVSAKTNVGIDELFMGIARKLPSDSSS